MRGANSNTLDTISAAATAIASAENRVPQASVQKRRWGSCLSIPWCFGSHKQTKRIGHAVLVPEATAPGTEVSSAENPSRAPSRVLPFIAPPSSPASFLQSEPPSGFHSPAGSVSFTSMSNCMCSPGPASMFSIGPYAHETQLVSPPVFSTFTTEPSTAPFTPPPESVQFTTPSSPDVPFARLFDPNHQNGKAGQRFPFSQCEFQPYHHHYTENPVSHLTSPGSGISASGTSSPFRIGDPPKLWNLDKLSALEWGPQQGSGSLTPDAVGPRSQDSFPLGQQSSYLPPCANSLNGRRNGEVTFDHRVSFEITAEDVLRCLAKEQSMARAMSPLVENAEVAAVEDENSSEVPNSHEVEKASADGEGGCRLQKHQSIYLGSVNEFNFENPDGGGDSDEHVAIGSDWWSNENVLVEGGPKNWSFFPMIQPGVS
ncbi:uncharacterized protein LOC131333513 [Rhododendron vialii]|uniref:uncharacterized protein LOC131333513 n=1 Tax=Rhododendron vialii TaxID=182163 RepID=UPI00265E0315|nr:uncharacterized protein LOC131333513 [Rhododendron vialii]